MVDVTAMIGFAHEWRPLSEQPYRATGITFISYSLDHRRNGSELPLPQGAEPVALPRYI